MKENTLSNPEDKSKHRRRIQNRKKKDFKLRSPIAKELVTNPALRPRVVKDKRGKEHDLDDLDHKTLVDLINED